MSKIKDLILVMMIGTLLFGLGVWVDQSDTSVVHAQSGDPYRYQLVNGTYGEQRCYAIKLDRQTGNTEILTVVKDCGNDKWRLLLLDDKR